MRTGDPCNKMIKTQNDIQHYKHTHPKTMPQPTKPHKGKASQGTIQVCDARVHYPIIKDQETNQPLHPHQGVPASDASDTQQRIMQIYLPPLLTRNRQLSIVFH